ncbi:MAG: hypothetical protein JO081_15265 [Alphaproteobacteria bacterium]|nr:hypothetical protein [Alphaproteobacteria bacterium]
MEPTTGWKLVVMLPCYPRRMAMCGRTARISRFIGHQAGKSREIMVKRYHKEYIQQPERRQKCGREETGLRRTPNLRRAACLAGLMLVAACDPVQIVEGDETHVSIRYDGVMNGLDEATALAQKTCAEHGRTARLRRTYHEGLGVGERFAFYDCV